MIYKQKIYIYKNIATPKEGVLIKTNLLKRKKPVKIA